MKKLLFVFVAFAASFLFSQNSNAQQLKIGYFDEQQLLPIMPGYAKLDTLMAVYQNDSLGVEYNYTYSDFQRSDSIFKKDSATMPAKARELAIRDLNQLKYKLINWQQYAEQMMSSKQELLLQPFRRKIQEALVAVVEENKYTMVLNANALTPYLQPPLLDNITLRVAFKMKLPIPKEIEDAWKAATGASGAAKAPVKK